jgi:hypothetical protein
MNSTTPPDIRTRGSWLERITAVVLLAVLVALGWMVIVACQPTWFRLGSTEEEVMGLLGLLVAALVLVSLTALRKTHP